MSDNSDLTARRIVVTRPENQSASLIEALRQRGAVPIRFPVIRIEPLPDVPGLEEALCKLRSYNWAIFTSVNGVKIFWEWLGRLNMSHHTLLELDVAAIGPAMADELRALGVSPVFVLNPLNLPGAPVVSCIGPITAEAAAQAGYLTEVVAETYNVEGLLKALVQFFGKRETA